MYAVQTSRLFVLWFEMLVFVILVVCDNLTLGRDLWQPVSLSRAVYTRSSDARDYDNTTLIHDDFD